MILSAAERQLIETLRHVSNLTLIVHADRGQCHVRIARNGGEFAAGSGEDFDTGWHDAADTRH